MGGASSCAVVQHVHMLVHVDPPRRSLLECVRIASHIASSYKHSHSSKLKQTQKQTHKTKSYPELLVTVTQCCHLVVPVPAHQLTE